MFDLAAWWRDFTRAFKELKPLVAVALLLVILNVEVILQWDDITEAAKAAGADDMLWIFGVCLAGSATIVQQTIFEYQKAMARRPESPLETVSSVSIDRHILDRWSKVRARYPAIDPDDSRAQLEAFPAQLALILELDRVRGLSVERATRRRLRKRIGTIMRECLSPLAAEMQAQRGFDTHYHRILAEETAAEKEVMTAIRAEASETRQLAVEAYAQELLRAT